MHHKKRSHKNFAPSRKYNIDHYQVNRLERLEKNIFFLFTLAVITSIIFLYAYSPITGHAVLSSQLDQNSYDAGEKITGIVSLEMQEGDILPEDSKISFVVSGDQTKCQTKYVCPVSGEVDWYKINLTSDECYVKNADPEKSCCSANPLNCNQIIRNSGFENELNNWDFSKIGNSKPYASQDNLTIYGDEGELIYNSKVAKLSTTEITSDGSAVLTQTFATPIVVGGLISNQPNLIVSDIKYYQDNFNLVYNITICNIGYGKITVPFLVRTIIKKENNLIGSSAYQIKQNLTAGQCISNISRSYKESGNYTLMVMADANLTSRPLGYINETNESDNTKQISINNYYVRNLYFGTNNITYDGSLIINYTIEVCNDYNTSLGPFNVSIYSPISNSNPWGTNEPTTSTTPNTYIQFTTIPAGTCSKQSKIYSLIILNPPYPAIMNPLQNGTYYYWIWIDKENRINDRTEDNKPQGSFNVGAIGGTHEEAVFSTDNSNNELEEQKILLFDSTPGFSSTNNFSLGWMAYVDLSYQTGCAFEIIVNGSNSSTQKRLHYYYTISDVCSVPANTAIDKYLTQTYGYNTGLLDVYTNLYQNWMVEYPNGASDKLTSISIVSHGKKIGEELYAQDVYFDNIRLDKTSNLQSTNEMSCEAKDKVCCLEGAGSGVYYGEQLSCSEGYECWEKCAQKEYTLTQFIAASSTPNKNNKTEGDCQVQTDSGQIGLEDYCGEYTGCLDCAGEGYTACLDTSSTSARTSCRNWDNIYSLNLSKLSLYAPSSNGTYSLNVLFTYKTIGLELINISTYGVPLIVGAGEEIIVPTCLDTDYVNCTGTWSQCDAQNTKTRNAICYYSGIQSCPSTKSISQTEQCYIQSNVTTCTEYDWGCDDWSTCEGGSQIRTCNLVSTSCDATLSGSYVPSQQQACETTEKTGFDIKYLIYAGIGLVLLVGIFFLIKFLISHESKKESAYQSVESSKIGKEKEKTEKTEKKEDYPELANYIKDALAAGMNPSEIRLKLQEAGWPKNIIDSVFKKFE